MEGPICFTRTRSKPDPDAGTRGLELSLPVEA